ncbi:MAG TPA: TlpA disulfide reductase family protein [Anaeromyxobacteraceae bacterium]
MKLLLLGAAAAVVAEIAVRQTRGRPAEGEAPAFALPDLDGREVSLASLRGRVVAVNFWATWCAPCREEIPDLARVYAANRNRCFEMLGVAEESGGRDAVAQAAKELGINYPVLLDERGQAGDAFRIPGYPRTYVIDHAGQIRATVEGAVSRRELESLLEPLLASAPAGCGKAL